MNVGRVLYISFSIIFVYFLTLFPSDVRKPNYAMAADETLHYKNQSIFHAIGFILVIGVNLLAVKMPINGMRTSEIAEKYAHLLLPATVTLNVWGAIYLALFAFIVYQLWLAFWGDHPQELTRLMTHMRYWWLISCVANAGWFFAWHYSDAARR